MVGENSKVGFKKWNKVNKQILINIEQLNSLTKNHPKLEIEFKEKDRIYSRENNLRRFNISTKSEEGPEITVIINYEGRITQRKWRTNAAINGKI
jgi:hypothetical protein